jgi:hypothetical protein
MTTKVKELSPRAAVLQKARKLASAKDGWMSPTDDNISAEAAEDFGTFEIEQQEGWEQTCHFDLLYGNPLRDMGYKDAYAQGFDESEHQEAALYFHELFYVPLKDAFWEAWAEAHNLYAFWEKNVKGKA